MLSVRRLHCSKPLVSSCIEFLERPLKYDCLKLANFVISASCLAAIFCCSAAIFSCDDNSAKRDFCSADA